MSTNSPIPILFTHYGDEWVRGSEIILLDLMRSLSPERFRPIVWCNGREMQLQSQAAGFATYRTQFRPVLHHGLFKSSPVYFWQMVAECRSICRNHNVRILHSNSAAPTQWLVPAACSLRLPVVTHLHIDYLRRSRFEFLLHAATVLVGVSKHVLLGPAADGVAAKRLRVIYNGINFERLGGGSATVRKRCGIPAQAFVIVSAGSLIDRKGFDILIRAFSKLPNGELAPHLLIMGDGPKRGCLEKLATELHVAERIHFVGHVTNTADFYVDADVFALASRADAFGLVLAEAGYFGLPSVATRVGGIPEVVLDHETGLLVSVGDVDDLRDKLEALMKDDGLRSKLGAGAALRVREQFSLKNMVEEFEALYCCLIDVPVQKLGWGAVCGAIARPYAKLLFSARVDR